MDESSRKHYGSSGSEVGPIQNGSGPIPAACGGDPAAVVGEIDGVPSERHQSTSIFCGYPILGPCLFDHLGEIYFEVTEGWDCTLGGACSIEMGIPSSSDISSHDSLFGYPLGEPMGFEWDLGCCWGDPLLEDLVQG